MRILYCSCKTKFKGGAEIYLENLQKILQSNKEFQTEIVYFSERKKSILKAGILEEEFINLIKIIEYFKPDIIHFNKRIELDIIQFSKIKSYLIPIVLSIHDYYSVPIARGIKSWIKNKLNPVIHFVDYFTIPSESHRKKLEKRGVRNVVHIPNSIDEIEWPPTIRTGLNTSKIELLYVGRLVRAKGIFMLLKAFNNLHIDKPIRLTFIGDGPDKALLHEKINQSPRSVSIRLVGFQEAKNVGEYYRNASVLIIPTTVDEMFGLVGIEAQASGLPVIVSDSPGVREWCHHREDGLVFRKGDVKSLQQQIIQLLNEEGLYIKLSKNGLMNVQNFYTNQIIAPKMISFYQTVVYEFQK